MNCEQILVSIIILTKNGGKIFQKSIQKIFSQKCSLTYEVIVVDSGSTDGTIEYIKTYPVRLYTIKPHEFSFGPTRDYAFSLSKGQYIVTLSQDVVPATDNWLIKLVEPLIANKADVVQGGG